MKRLYVAFGLAICITCTACGSGETSEPESASEYTEEKFENVDVSNNEDQATVEESSDPAEEPTVSSDEPAADSNVSEDAGISDSQDSETVEMSQDIETNIGKYIDDFNAGLDLKSEYSFVKDCTIVLDNKNIMFLLVVEDNTDPEEATNLGDTLVRQFNSYVCSYDSSIAPDDDDYFGGLYETYNAMVGIAETSKTGDTSEWLANYGIIQGNVKVDLPD